MVRAAEREALISINARSPWTAELERRETGHDTTEAERILAQSRTHEVDHRGRRVAFVEDQVNHLEHRAQARAELFTLRHLERHLLFRERALRARRRWAMVGSGTRNARASSSVVRPPSSRSVSATRASMLSTG